MITNRLQAILDMVDDKTIADIGCDHAYIPIRLAADRKVIKAIACDKNRGPLEIAKNNVKKYNLQHIIELRLGEGLSALYPKEVETIIIAGMGGVLIGDIIEENIETAKASTLILQPMNSQYELRKRLKALGFSIISEGLASEGFKVYNLMKVKWGKDNEITDEIYYHIPESLLSHPLCPMLIAKKRREFTRILRGFEKSEQNFDNEKYEKLLSELNKLERNE